MKFGKKLERLLLAEMGVCLIVLLLSMSGRCSSMAILLSTLFQIFMIIYIIVVLVHPLQAYARILEHLNKTEFEREELRMAPAGVPFVKETYSLLDRYAAYKTRKNNAQILNKQTELTALQSQINPHFLYNTLETIRGQALIDDNEEIAKMVEALSAFFRYSISRKGNLVTLRDELANIENYMLIQRYRFNNRFSMEVLIDEEDEEAFDFLIPRLIIQPVVENAIEHGIDEKEDGDKKIFLSFRGNGDDVVITVRDNGMGMPQEKAETLVTYQAKGYGYAERIECQNSI